MDKIRSEAVVPKEEGLGKGKDQIVTIVALYALCSAQGTYLR